MKRNSYLFGLFLLCNFYTVKAQNLLRNGSFEEHAEQQCLNCNIAWGKYPGMVYHWDNAGWGCILCDKKYKRTSGEKEAQFCPLDKVQPHSGNAMIQMGYSPSSGGCVHEGADYLVSKTTQSMQVGKMYEISFWIHIESKKRSDPDWAKHIGITLLPQNLKMHGLGWHDGTFIFPSVPIDTVLYDSWYPVKWRIRPLCASNYLMIGVFEDQHWGQKRKGPNVQYFLDQVSVTEIPSVSAVSDSSIYYCSRYDPIALGIPPQMDNQALLFQNDAFALTEAHKTVLDSFVEFAKKYPDLVFELSGHTDSIGSKNQQLSEARVQSVFQYLTEIKQLPDFRFIKLAMGSKEQARTNSTEAGRAMNRRVEIRQSNLDLPNIFYRKALKAVEQERYPEAFSFLDKWVKKLHPTVGTGMIVQFDPRFEVLHQDKRWIALNQKIRNKFSKIKYAGSAFQLDSMRLDDLSASGDLTSMGYLSGLNALSGFHPEMDSVRFEMEPLPVSTIQKKHAQHFAALLPILNKTGWPKKSEFGESACNSAFSILLNSNNVSEYQRWLPAIKKSCEEGETPWIFYAKLYDHCNLALGKPQRYVTVVSMDDGELWVKPWEGDENSINEWRAKIGLPLLSYKVAEAMKKLSERP
jgi:outer membrane protein OmpA-like peptidoglycan-associated protein